MLANQAMLLQKPFLCSFEILAGNMTPMYTLEEYTYRALRMPRGIYRKKVL